MRTVTRGKSALNKRALLKFEFSNRQWVTVLVFLWVSSICRYKEKQYILFYKHIENEKSWEKAKQIYVFHLFIGIIISFIKIC